MPKNLGRYDNDLSVPRKKDIDSLESRVKTNEDNIAMAESDIEGLQGDIGTLQTDVGAVKIALESKQDTIVGGASTIVEDNLTADRALVSDASGKVAVSEVTSTELGHLSGITSGVQEQINKKANQTALDGVRYQLAAKADQSAMDALRSQVNTKASQIALNNLNTRVGHALTNGEIVVFSSTKNYSHGVYVWYNNTLYCANEDIPAGAWDATKWTAIAVVDELDKKYSADNPPPYPVTSVNTKTGEVTLTASDVNAVSTTGNETISGTKTFSGAVKLNGGIDVKSNGNAILNVEGVSTTVDYIDVWVDGGTNKNRPLVLQTNSATTGNVGIGTATPSSKLEVKGNVKATSFSGDGSGLTNIPYPITSVNTKTGEVVLTAKDVGALPLTGGELSNILYITNSENPSISLSKDREKEDGGFDGTILYKNSRVVDDSQKSTYMTLDPESQAIKLSGATVDGINLPQTLTGIKAGTADNDAVNVAQLKQYLPLSGGTLTGRLTVGGGVPLAINQKNYSATVGNITRPASILGYFPGNITAQGRGLGIAIGFPVSSGQADVSGPILIQAGKIGLDGDTYMNNHRIYNLLTPSSDTDAANKKYVDDNTSIQFSTYTYPLPGLQAGETQSFRLELDTAINCDKFIGVFPTSGYDVIISPQLRLRQTGAITFISDIVVLVYNHTNEVYQDVDIKLMVFYKQ